MYLLYPGDVVLLGLRSGPIGHHIISAIGYLASTWRHGYQANSRILSYEGKNLIAVAVKTEPDQFSRLLAGFMMITCFCESLWISDTACAALMAPIAYSLLEIIMIHKVRPVAMTGNGIVSQEQLAKR
ncbi:hypothetical protein GCK32_009263 [Trichostrongylus colubriformis]|uniref:Uncharacterized protein n=1 Tax=Trichostrongylus colubriformis TaxID=6319 RepID=A0AAN8FQF8_TRICO